MAQQTLTPAHNKLMAVAAAKRWTTFAQGVYFVLGFATFVMVVMGAATTVLGDVFYDGRKYIQFFGGIVLILFGLFTMKLVRIPFLNADTRQGFSGVQRGVGAAQSYLTGLSFAAGWTPCIGPFLGAILSLGAASPLALRLGLLFAYVLGLGIPFLAFALLFDKLTPVLNALKRNMRVIEIVSGILLIVIGVGLLTGGVSQLSTFLQRFDLSLETKILGDGAGALTLPVAFAAGLLSFVSPCVLPLVPAYLGFIGGWAVNNAGAKQ